MQCKVKITKEILDLWKEYRPEVGKVYDADVTEYFYRKDKKRSVAVIDLDGKKILLRLGEFEIVEGKA